jgi:hypothetical protein
MRALALALLLAVFGAAPVAAQEDLGGLRDTLATLWARGDAAALAGLSAEPGIDLELGGPPLGHLGGRRAAAALRHLFTLQETVSVRPGATERVPGAENRAFGELSWEIRVTGAPLTERSTVFVALVREPVGWRVSQIRILP